MSSTYSTNLAIELMGTGDQAGTWGTTTNTNLGTLIEQAISGYVTQAITDGADTVITIPNGASGVARNMYLELTGALTAARNLIVPANKKLYFIYNNTTGGYAVTVKVSGQTGVSVPNGSKMILVSNGTDVVNATNYSSGSGTLPVINGGTGQNSYTDGQLLIGNSTGNTLTKSTLTAGSGVSISNGSGSITISATGSGGTVTSVSVDSANGFAGTSSGGTTPALTLSTTVNGVLKGNGTAISAAVSGTDYAPATSGTSILYGNGSGGFSSVTVGSNLTFVGGTLSAATPGGMSLLTTVTPPGASVAFSITGLAACKTYILVFSAASVSAGAGTNLLMTISDGTNSVTNTIATGFTSGIVTGVSQIYNVSASTAPNYSVATSSFNGVSPTTVLLPLSVSSWGQVNSITLNSAWTGSGSVSVYGIN